MTMKIGGTEKQFVVDIRSLVAINHRVLTLNTLIPEIKDKKPLVGMDWLREFKSTLQNFQHATNRAEQPEVNNKLTFFENLFYRTE